MIGCCIEYRDLEGRIETTHTGWVIFILQPDAYRPRNGSIPYAS